MDIKILNPNLSQLEGTEIIESRTERGKTSRLSETQYAADNTMHSMHYKDNYADANEPWKDIDLTPIENSDHFYNDKSPYIVKIYKDPVVGYEITSKRTGHKFTVILDDKKPDKLDVDFNIELHPNRVRLWKTVKNSKVKKLKWKIKEEGSGGLVFRDNPEAYDLDEGIPEVKITKTKIKDKEFYWEEELTGISYINSESPIAAKVPKTLTYPVRVDTDVDETLAATQDTAYWIVGGTYFLTPTDRWNAGTYDASNVGYGACARYTTVNIPRLAIINVATVTCTCTTAFTGTDVRTTFDAVAEDNPGVPASPYATFMARARTTAKTNWSFSTSWSVGTAYTSIGIVNVIQEIVDRAGWSANNSLLLCWNNNASPTSAQNLRRGANYAHATYPTGPALHITYTVGIKSWVLTGGAWKFIIAPSILVSGVWKTVTRAWVLIGGVWKESV